MMLGMAGLTIANLLLAGAEAPSDALQAYLVDCAERYDDGLSMVGVEWHGPGYHSTMKRGEWVHPTRNSLAYALGLLQSGDRDNAARAANIVRAVIALQDQGPEHKTYGIWPWLFEEPLEKMAPPDWNWADFCGALLAQMLVEHADQLDADLIDTMRDSLGHAARAIVRRDVKPSYTNIAIMGGGVTAAAGEILDESDLLEYGRDRLRRCVEHHDYHGGFNEYNSPTYTMVALHECERVLQLVKDPAAREHAEALRRDAWQVIAEHYHPGTGQWAGPHSRDYHTWLPAHRAAYIAAQTGVDIPVHPDAAGSGGGWPDLIKPLPCPPEWVDRFRKLPEPEVTVRRRVIRRDTDEASTWITTWLTPDVCLGSVNHDTLWAQRQVVKAYWNGDEAPVMLRLHFLHDGVDFASGYVHNAQDGGRVLSVISLVTNRGDFHPTLDRPDDGVFRAEDFRVRYELIGTDVAVEDLGSGRYEFRAGDTIKAVVHTTPSRFDGNAVAWEAGMEEGNAIVDGICYHGPERAFKLTDISDMAIVLGLEVLPAEDAPTNQGPTYEVEDSRAVNASWPVNSALSVKAPPSPHGEY